MTYRLKRIGVLRAAIVAGIAYAILSLLFVPFLFFVAMLPGPQGLENDWMLGPAFALLMPFIYGAVGFVSGAAMAFVYNLVAMMVGGLEFDLEGEGGLPARTGTIDPAY